jgi:maltooligosyltrehalose trehalohydrolase
MSTERVNRRWPVGAELQQGGGVHFRLWAPQQHKAEVVLEEGNRHIALERESSGYFSGFVPEARAGTRYRFGFGGPTFPDPASRFQPEGPHGPSQVIDPRDFSWTDRDWKGVDREHLVVYELHIGTFTREGTWATAARELPKLAELGVNAVEVMPVADFPGKFGWGYDGVDLFAPTRLYGTPNDFRSFVDQAHAAGVGVILDVVYNHLGPDGNYLKAFSPGYFTNRYKNEWGEAINFDGPDSGPAREFFITNAAYWIDEFHIDGLRLDATQQIFDASPDHVLAAMARKVHEVARGRQVFLVAENDTQESKLVRPPAQGGYGLDGIWNDDFHHSARVAMTGQNEAYYSDFLGKPQEFISAAKCGFLFQGQRYAWHKKRRGGPTHGVPLTAFVNFIDNHDQISNSARGLRCHQLTTPGKHRAFTALMILMPGTPMLFQGQEFSASAPFVFFADHNPKLAQLVSKGRREFLKQFPSVARPEVQASIAEPCDVRTFESCKLDWAERDRNTAVVALHRDLLRLRREQRAFDVKERTQIDGAVLGAEAFVLRYFHAGGDRLLVVNLGKDLHVNPAPEPLLAPPDGKRWEILWSSEDQRYGGKGTPPLDTDDNWRIPGEAAVVLEPK